MARKRRGPGAGNTEAPKKNAPIKSKPDNNQASRRAQHRMRESAENRGSARREYVVYDGQRLLGSFIFNETTGQALAWNARRKFIGRFVGYQAAARAISRAAITERHAVEARHRQVDPRPEFVTGLSERFLRRDY